MKISPDTPPYEMLTIVADSVHSCSDADLVAKRPELIEVLECACDYIAVQAAAIDSLQRQAAPVEADPHYRPERDVNVFRKWYFLLGLGFGFVSGLAWFSL